jgi:hypothetical protein
VKVIGPPYDELVPDTCHLEIVSSGFSTTSRSSTWSSTGSRLSTLVLLGSVAQTHDQITAHNVAHRIPHHPWIEALARDERAREELPPAVRGVSVATNLMADGVRFPMHFDNFRHVTGLTVNHNGGRDGNRYH